MLNKLISNLGIAKQTAKGTPATAPTYITPLVGTGYVAGVESKPKVDEETGQAYAINAYLEEIASSFDATFRAYPPTVGLLLYALLGTVKTTPVDGKTGFYKHVFTVDPVSQATPWLTLWGNIESEYVKSSDAKLGDLEVSWKGNEPVSLAATFAALSVLFGSGAARPSGGTDMAGSAYITPAGLAFSADVGGTSLVSKDITEFSLKMSRNVDPSYVSGSPLPKDVSMGKFEAKPKIVTKPDSLDDVRKSLTGSTTGTTPAASIVYGSYDLKLTLADDSLEIASPKVPFSVKWPESDAGGGAVEVELSADNQLGTASVSPVTVTLINQTESYA